MDPTRVSSGERERLERGTSALLYLATLRALPEGEQDSPRTLAQVLLAKVEGRPFVAVQSWHFTYPAVGPGLTPASVVSVMAAAAGGSSLLGICGKWLGAWCTWKAVTVVDSGVEDVKLVMRSTAIEATEVINTRPYLFGFWNLMQSRP